jgi:hypothetical protein
MAASAPTTKSKQLPKKGEKDKRNGTKADHKKEGKQTYFYRLESRGIRQIARMCYIYTVITR